MTSPGPSIRMRSENAILSADARRDAHRASWLARRDDARPRTSWHTRGVRRWLRVQRWRDARRLRTVEPCATTSHRVCRPIPSPTTPVTRRRRLDAVEPGQPLDPQERMAVEADLADLAVYEALLAHKGIRGLVVCCDECQQDHYHDWDMLRANLLQLLVDGTVRPHEPAYDPEPDAYVTWDYCRGTPTPRSTRRRRTPRDSTDAAEPGLLVLATRSG